MVTYGRLNKYLGHNIYFLDWTLRMLPVSILVVLGVGVMMYFMRTDRENFGGSKEFYRQELARLGPMSYEETVSFYGFALAIALAVLQPLYAPYAKGPQWAWLQPTQLFCIIPLLLLFWPSRSARGESILSPQTLRDHFPVTILFMWPAAVALSKILGATGASAVFGQWLTPFGSPARPSAGVTPWLRPPAHRALWPVTGPTCAPCFSGVWRPRRFQWPSPFSISGWQWQY